ncbi:MAG: FG-GAP repeat protein [Alphaproteobacteria bacterium]|nr:FG-GAP repeat protein [Alphaproteobacteria bacterium]
MIPRILLGILLLPGCLKPSTLDSGTDDSAVTGTDSDDPGDDSGGPVDLDGDGFNADEDCDDDNAAVNPGATELCNGIDDDCDQQIDNEAQDAGTWYTDADGDGFGSAAVTDCEQPDDAVEVDGDCDDTDASVNPDAEERFDGIDNDCADGVDRLDAEEATRWTVLGLNRDDAIGEHVWAPGDVDSDGATDLLIGAPLYDHGGRADKGVLAFHDADDMGIGREINEGWLSLVGASGDAWLGASAALIDPDAPSRLAVGAPWLNETHTDNGVVFLLRPASEGGITTLDGAVYEARLFGREDYDYNGQALASGDLDGDGVRDLAIGAPGDEDTKGRVYIALGGGDLETTNHKVDDTEYHVKGREAGDNVGSALFVADMDGDGDNDVWMCSAGDDDGGSNAGACYLVNGQSSFSGNDRPDEVDVAKVYGAGAEDGVGTRDGQLAAADFDGDGTMDLAVGVPGDDSAQVDGGAVWIFTGPLSGALSVNEVSVRFNGTGALGAAVVSSGDHDGDGDPDLLVGAPTWQDAGGVLLLNLNGLTGVISADDAAAAAWRGAEPEDNFGASLSAAVDLDGDGTQDVAAGAPGNDEAAQDAGKVYVLPGREN